MKKVLVAMSGGVDSSVTALLLKNAGFDVFGAMLHLFPEGNLINEPPLGGTSDAEKDAGKVAERLGIPFSLFDASDVFRNTVMQYFADTYLCGGTPNPCVECNKQVKFGHLRKLADSTGCDAIATGHYAKIERDAGGRYLIRKAKDLSKDQSYVLWQLSQDQLSHTILPLGEYSKAEIRELAAQNGLPNASRHDSQDICFVPDGDYAGFLKRFTGKDHFEGGCFRDLSGKELGRHPGIEHYTIGQRKGLGIAFGVPTYVISKSAVDHSVTLGTNEDLFSRELTAEKLNWVAFDRLDAPMRVMAKARYNAVPAPATVEQTDETHFRLVFDNPQRAICRGQSAVLYSDDVLLGGGIIE